MKNKMKEEYIEEDKGFGIIYMFKAWFIIIIIAIFFPIIYYKAFRDERW